MLAAYFLMVDGWLYYLKRSPKVLQAACDVALDYCIK